VSRLAVEKGVDVAVDACRIAGMPLVVAGDGPELEVLRERASGAEVSFRGRVDDPTLVRLRAGAAIALAPSRSAETFGLAVAEAMAAGLPVAASRVGAIPELLEGDALVAPGDARGLADAVARLAGDSAAGLRNLERVRAVCAPEIVARGLGDAYGGER
jgi:glycosyltransferase involved in cell wall biosynthesis